MPGRPHEFQPTVSAEYAERIREWHEQAYADLRERETVEILYLGSKLAVPPKVFAPTQMSDLFGRTVLEEVRELDRVLDMGTGSGNNVDGSFDLIIFDPPFRWFPPHDMLEAANHRRELRRHDPLHD